MRTDICDAWLTDSGASAHITFRKDWFAEFRQIEGDTVSLGDDGVCAIEGVGKIRVKKLVNGTWQDGTIENVLFVPSVKKNLFSVGVCTMKRYSVQFKGFNVKVERDGQIMVIGARQLNQIFRMVFFYRVRKKKRMCQ